MKVFDTNLTFAVRCGDCGRIKFHRISTFQILSSNESVFYCNCGSREMAVALKGRKTIIVDIPCLACDTDHTYKYNLKSIMKKKLTIICCDETGLELCFLGSNKDVQDMVFKYQEDLNMLMGELGMI